MQANPLTKTEAALLYGYGYRLIGEGKEWDMDHPEDGYLYLIDKEGTINSIDINDTGTDYHVLVHPLSRLTAEIDFAWDMYKNHGKGHTTIVGFFSAIKSHIDFFGVNTLSGSLLEFLNEKHFDTMNFLERGIGKEITV